MLFPLTCAINDVPRGGRFFNKKSSGYSCSDICPVLALIGREYSGIEYIYQVLPPSPSAPGPPAGLRQPAPVVPFWRLAALYTPDIRYLMHRLPFLSNLGKGGGIFYVVFFFLAEMVTFFKTMVEIIQSISH